MSDPTALQPGPVTTDAQATTESQATAPVGKPSSLWSDAWHELRRKPLFIISSVLLLVILVMAAFPQLFTSVNPEWADLKKSLQPPSSEHIFGIDIQGRDVFARTIYGARTSILVGVLATLASTLIGGLFGIVAGYLGRWADTLISRFAEIFLGLPYVLGAIIVLSTLAPVSSDPSRLRIMVIVILVMALLGWPILMRISRSAILAVKHSDYVMAARGLGASPMRIVFRHLLPNALAPIIVVATITVGSYIGVEATLSFLGVGLRSPVISWGLAISEHANYLRTAPHALLFPAAFLSATVLTFVMLGDAVRDALDPKLR
ncbi:ABC transporter permease [Bailinhaonella thermotolerans]|uniref:ABC transporter permease n=1 Tax=Bailinhaonella thermotolerans TaxID=1070861 RepID=A0A3A4AZM6_9ACTN|nr:ABC transporter permease [Bailinhaonella thermotolerans]RJL33118.1 ABC transporter permease [Bailinhaonella thermotolerans]